MGSAALAAARSWPITAALAWIGERTFAWPNPFEAVVNGLAHHAGWLVAGLAVAALVTTWGRRGRVTAPRGEPSPPPL